MVEKTRLKSCGKTLLVGGQSVVQRRIILSKDSRFLFCASGRRIHVYSTSTAELVRELKGHTGDVSDLSLNPSNQLQLVSCCHAGEIIFWDFSDGAILKKFGLRCPLTCLYLHPAHQDLAFLTMQCKSDKKEKKPKYKVVVLNLKQDITEEGLKTRTLLSKISSRYKQTAVSAEGDYIGAVKKRKFFLWSLKSNKQIVHKSPGSMFMCLAFHPSRLCAATGHSDGQIKIWNGLDRKQAVTTILHWHAHPVEDLQFTNDGSYLLSGGTECVLVLWQFQTHHKQFLPRLGAHITGITSTADDTLVAVSHTDNVITLVSGVDLKVRKRIQGLTKGSKLDSGLVFDPRSGSIILNSMPGRLQFFCPDTQSQVLNLDVLHQNYVSKPSSEPLIYTEVKFVSFLQDGSWMATVEHRDDKCTVPELKLKFWEFSDVSQKYVLNTCADPPHDQPVTALQFQPQQDTRSSPLLVTSSLDGQFKVWCLQEYKEIKATRFAWMCQSVGFYCDMPCVDAKFSQDGSILAVAHKQVISVWVAEENELKTTLQMPRCQSDIKQLLFGNNESAQYLLVSSGDYLTVWNLLTLSVWWRLETSVSAFAADPFSRHVAVFCRSDDQTHLYVFDPSSAQPVAQQENVSSGKQVSSATFHPRLSAADPSDNSDEFTFGSQLFFLTEKQEIFTVTADEEEERNLSRKLHTEQTHVGMEEFRKIFGESNSGTARSASTPARKAAVHGTPSRGVVREIISTPCHVLPPVQALCEKFLNSMMLDNSEHSSTKYDSGDDSDDDEHDDEFAREEDSDSDMDTADPPSIEQAQKQGSSAPTAAPLNSACIGEFSWLKDVLI